MYLGFYYFIFTNENEITSNFIAAHFDLHKTVFDVSEPEERCVNTTDCSLHLAFFSEQHVVLEVAQAQGEVQKFLLNRLVDFSIKWVPLVHLGK